MNLGKSSGFWIDVHTHLHFLKPSCSEIIKSAKKNNVRRLITVGTNGEDWPKVLDSLNPPEVYGAIGCHPHSAKDYNDSLEEQLTRGLKNKAITALGEIGLDYYYENSDCTVQKQVFRRQMEIAAQAKLPIEVHTRQAEEDTVEILKEYKGRVRGLIHCFTGSWNMAKSVLDLGYNISWSGIVTFKNAESLRETCSKIPLDRLHIETDAPYLAPVPFRGKENQPAWLVHTAQKISEIHGVSLETLKEHTWNSALELFKWEAEKE